MKVLLALIVGAALAVTGVQLGVWWAPFAVGIAFGVVEPRARFAVPGGALIGLAAWGLPLAVAELRFGLGPTAQSLATIMGFGHQPAIPLALTCATGLLLGLAGAWLGSGARSLVAPNAPVDAERTE